MAATLRIWLMVRQIDDYSNASHLRHSQSSHRLWNWKNRSLWICALLHWIRLTWNLIYYHADWACLLDFLSVVHHRFRCAHLPQFFYFLRYRQHRINHRSPLAFRMCNRLSFNLLYHNCLQSYNFLLKKAQQAARPHQTSPRQNGNGYPGSPVCFFISDALHLFIQPLTSRIWSAIGALQKWRLVGGYFFASIDYFFIFWQVHIFPYLCNVSAADSVLDVGIRGVFCTSIGSRRWPFSAMIFKILIIHIAWNTDSDNYSENAYAPKP